MWTELALGSAAGAAVAAGLWWPRWRRRRQESRRAAARQQFHRGREWLEARFLTLASRSGMPRGLRWANCDFEDSYSLARDRHSGELRALVGVTIRFEAVEGGGLEGNPNVHNLRAATVVFRHVDGEWQTDGRAIFNLSPAETIEHYHHELEMVDS